MIDQILAAYRDAGLAACGEGAELPALAELMEYDDTPDPCGGTGQIAIEFGGQVIQIVPCPRCRPDA